METAELKAEGGGQRDEVRACRFSSFWLMTSLLALFAASKAILFDTLDPDSFWHLRVAEQLQKQGIGPIVDDLSFASIKTPWTPYSWLAELGMKTLWDFGGYRAAIVAQALMMAGLVFFIALAAWELTRRNDERGNPLAVIIAVVFAELSTLAYLSFRPATFAFMLLALCAWLLLRDRRMNEQSRAVWWIVPITLLTTNCHFFAVLVPAYVAALLFGSLWEADLIPSPLYTGERARVRGRVSTKPPLSPTLSPEYEGEGERRRIKRYGWMLGLTSLSCLCTPMLFGVIRTMWQYQSEDPMIGGGIIAELRPSWGDPSWIITMLLCLGVLCYNRKKLRAGEWIWIIGCLILDLRLARFAPIFAPIAAASLAATLPTMSDRVLNRPSIRAAIACVLLIGFGRIAFAFPASDMPLGKWLNRHGPDIPGYPADAADFVADHVTPASGRLINEFSWGGFLEWRLRDHYQVLLDGRTQLYSPQFWQATYLQKPERSRAVLTDAHADAAIVPIDRSRFRSVLLEMGWKSAYRDDRAEVLLPPASSAMNASISD